jgi:uncharacterized protein YndB with AHSA1/START domain
MSNPDSAANTTLRISRIVRVPPERAFAAWTDPKHVVHWWGPPGVTCTEAHIDLRVGGEYGIANQFADGRIIWIRGTFEAVDPPRRLVYSWRLDGEPHTAGAERVTVSFERRPGDATNIVVLHERVPSEERRRSHQAGWNGCLDGFVTFVESRG